MSEPYEMVDAGDTVETDERRMRMNLALLHLRLPAPAPIAFMAEWLLVQPAPTDGISGDPTDLGVTVAGSLDRVMWSGAGEPALFGGRIAMYLEGRTTPEEELALFGRVTAELSPAQLGSWVQIDGASLGYGWLLDGEFALKTAIPVASPDCPGLEDLLAWAESAGITNCSRLWRSLAPLGATEFTIPLVGDSASEQLAAARKAFDILDKPWPGADLELALGEHAPSALALVASFSADGPLRLGVRADGPVPELTQGLSTMYGEVDKKTLGELRGVLGSEPSWLICGVATGEPELELYYTP